MDAISLLGMAFVTVTLATVLGYFLDKSSGAITLFVLSATAAVFCFIGALLGWGGLIVASLLVAALAAGIGSALFGGRRGALALSLAWLGWCVLCIFGYQMGDGLAGFILITLPIVGLFWGGVYYLAQMLLPFSEATIPLANRLLAFRALLTYTLGTNYPYYTVEDQEITQRVPGNPSRLLFAGPGIVITSCDHAVITSTSIATLNKVMRTVKKEVKDPGLSFTGLSETITDVIDLRLQQRTLDIEAPTQDGVPINVTISIAFRIHTGDAQPEPGQPFPFRKSAAIKAITHGQPIGHLQKRVGDIVTEDIRKHTWEEMVSINTAQLVQRVIGQYSSDELCAAYAPNRNPRQEIRIKLQQQLEKELKPFGIQLVSSDIGNLMPADYKHLLQRVEKWQAEWVRQTAAEVGKGDPLYVYRVDLARAQAAMKMRQAIDEGIERSRAFGRAASADMLAVRVFETLGGVASSPAVHEALPPSVAKIIESTQRLAKNPTRRATGSSDE